MKKVIYISGPIGELPKSEYEGRFTEAEELLKKKYNDCIIYNPVRVTSHLNPAIHTWEQYMTANFEVLIKCNTIFMLDGWRDSKGASLEIAIAANLGMELLFCI